MTYVHTSFQYTVKINVDGVEVYVQDWLVAFIFF